MGTNYSDFHTPHLSIFFFIIHDKLINFSYLDVVDSLCVDIKMSLVCAAICLHGWIKVVCTVIILWLSLHSDDFCIHFGPYCNIHLYHLRFHFFAEAESDFFSNLVNHNFGIVHPVEIVLGCNSISLLRFPLCSHVYNYSTSIFCLLLDFE